MKFRKKPVEVEAILTKNVMGYPEVDIPNWLKSYYLEGKVRFLTNGILINTLEGEMLANPDDWLICGVAKEVYPCKSNIFEKTYEPI